MMSRKSGCLICLFSVFGPTPVSESTQPSTAAPFAGERIDYEVFWTGLLVGKISLIDFGVVEFDGAARHKVMVYAKTDGPIERIYEARRRYIGLMTPLRQPWRYEEWEREKKKWRMEEWLSFSPMEKLVRRYKKREIRNVLAYEDELFDPISAGTRLRSYALQPGDRYELEVTQGKYLYRATADVAPGERMATPIGEVDTVLVVPQVFWEGKPVGKRKMKVWFIADDRKIPVRVFADIEFGHFSAELVGYRPPGGAKTSGN